MNLYLIDKYEFYKELNVWDIEELEKYIENRKEPNYNKLLEYSSDSKEIKKLIKEALEEKVDVETLINIDTLY